MIKIRKNAYLLAQLKQLDPTGQQLIDLDDEEYLNPERTLKEHELGIDMEFMVALVGGEKSYSFIDEDEGL